MQTRRLGRSGIVVSEIGLGTMTFGLQTDESMATRILDRAFDAGINFIDTAELYPVPPEKRTYGATEEIVGRWLRGKTRDAVILATKIAGPAHGWFVPPAREGLTTIDRHQIKRAIEGSLRRLQTDYVDLYQTHWPDHGMRPEETLSALTELIEEGKVRVIGCSNETCWGLMRSLLASEKLGLARLDTVQNNFSLINRRCESELAQVCRQERVSLLPYSPLGGGVLSGKYNAQPYPPGARFTEYLERGEDRQRQMAERFVNPRSLETTRRLREIASGLGISVTTLAIAWTRQQDFVGSTLIGASHVDQLEETLKAADVTLDAATLRKIDEVDADIPNPMSEDGLRRL